MTSGELAVVAHAYNPSAPEMEARNLSETHLYNKFESSLGHMRPCLKNTMILKM